MTELNVPAVMIAASAWHMARVRVTRWSWPYCSARNRAQSPSTGFLSPMICSADRRSGSFGNSEDDALTARA